METKSTSQEMKKVYQVPAENLVRMLKKVQALNKKAAKLGLDGIKIEVIGEDKIVEKSQDIKIDGKWRIVKRMVEVRDVLVSGASPIIDGWILIGKVDHGDGGNIMHATPGYEIPAKYRTTDSFCDHCKTNRRRNFTYIVQHENGETKQVGKTCLKDFTGHQSPEAIVRYASWLVALDESFCEYEKDNCFDEAYWSLQETLELTANFIRRYGWVSKSEDGFGKIATAYEVMDTLTGNIRITEMPEITDDDREAVKKAIEWVENLEGDLNDYQHNLSLLVKRGYVRRRDFGFACSMIIASQREYKKREMKKVQGESKHIGQIKDRLDFKGVKVIFTKSFETMYGMSTLIKFVDPDGNLLVWFASSWKDVQSGDVYDIKGTIKKHDEYSGEKQTVLTRVKMTRVEADGE